MIHGIYVKTKPKSKWHLISITNSPEVANQDIKDAKIKAKLEGNDSAEFAIKIFDSRFYIPEFISEMTDQKPAFN